MRNYLRHFIAYARIFIHMCTWLLDYSDLHWALQSRSEVSSCALAFSVSVLVLHSRDKTKRELKEKKKTRNKWKITTQIQYPSSRQHFKEHFMIEQPKLIRLLCMFANALIYAFVFSLGDLLCPYETCFNLCVRYFGFL